MLCVQLGIVVCVISLKLGFCGFKFVYPELMLSKNLCCMVCYGHILDLICDLKDVVVIHFCGLFLHIVIIV